MSRLYFTVYSEFQHIKAEKDIQKVVLQQGVNVIYRVQNQPQFLIGQKASIRLPVTRNSPILAECFKLQISNSF